MSELKLTPCLGTISSGEQCSRQLSIVGFCFQHRKQMPTDKQNIHKNYYSNIGFFPLEIEQLIAEYCDPTTYLTLIIYNPMLHKPLIYAKKHILFEQEILYNLNEKCEYKFKLLVCELNDDIKAQKPKDYLYKHYTENKSYKYKTFKYETSLIAEDELKNNIIVQKKIGSLELINKINQYQKECKEKLLDIINKIFYI